MAYYLQRKESDEFNVAASPSVSCCIELSIINTIDPRETFSGVYVNTGYNLVTDTPS